MTERVIVRQNHQFEMEFLSIDPHQPESEEFRSDEAHDEAFAVGFGDPTVHEGATQPTDAARAYFSYYSGGFRARQIQGTELVETGGYLDPEDNNFWGVEVFVRDGCIYIADSDRDSGLWLFKDDQSCP